MGGGALLPPLGQAVGGHSRPSDVITPPSPSTVANFPSHHPIPSTSHPFGPQPSRREVEKAMSDLQCFMEEISAARKELSWLQGVLCTDHSRTVQSSGFGRFCDAFNMLQTQRSVQNMVLSIACDEAVWEAILNNKAVQDSQGLLSAETAAKEQEDSPSSSPEKLDIVAVIIKWIMDVLELIQKTGSLLNLIFQPVENTGTPSSELSDLLEEKIRSSFLLSIVLLLIVVATRIHEN